MQHVDDDDVYSDYRKWVLERQFRMSYVSRFPADQGAVFASGISPDILVFDYKFRAKPSEPVVFAAAREQWPQPQSRIRTSRKFSANQVAKSASTANRLARPAFRNYSRVIRKSRKVQLAHSAVATKQMVDDTSEYDTTTHAEPLSNTFLDYDVASVREFAGIAGGPPLPANDAADNILTPCLSPTAISDLCNTNVGIAFSVGVN